MKHPAHHERQAFAPFINVRDNALYERVRHAKAKFAPILLSHLWRYHVPAGPPPKGKHVVWQDAGFAACYKVMRRLSTLAVLPSLEEAVERGWMTRMYSRNALIGFFDHPDAEAKLRSALEATVVPMGPFETLFAADGTGFTGTTKTTHYDVQYRGRIEHRYQKVHFMVGLGTYVIAAVKFAPRDAPDHKQFASLLEATREHFCIDAVWADKGYAYQEVIKKITEAGAMPIVPPKANHTGGTQINSIWYRWYHLIAANPEAFWQCYAFRNHVETLFSSLKSVTDARVRNKTERAAQNEILCKCIVHNINCLIEGAVLLDLPLDLKGPSRSHALRSARHV